MRVGPLVSIICAMQADTLGTFAVTAPIAGDVLARHTNVGDVAGSEPLFEIADLSTLWLEVHEFGANAARLRPGVAVAVVNPAGEPVTTTLGRVLPLAASNSHPHRHEPMTHSHPRFPDLHHRHRH